MAGLSDYAEIALLDHVTGRAAMTAPTNVYLQLHVGNPGEAGTANPGGTTTREQLAFSAASAGSIAASGSPVARWDSWGATQSLTHFTIWDAASGGNCLWNDALTAPIAATSGNPVEIASLTLSAD